MGIQHYVFAHRALPQLLKEDTDKYVNGIASDQGPDFLQRLWRHVGELQGENSPAHGLGRFKAQINNECFAVVIRLPKPQEMTEAHFVAIVYWPARLAAAAGGEASYRYFTLELSENEDGDQITMLCEWKGGTHANYGEGPPPDERAFLQSVIQHLNRGGAQPGSRPRY